MPWFMTAYYADGRDPIKDNMGGSYTGWLWARDLRHAKHLSKKRKLNEAINLVPGGERAPYMLPSEWLAKRRPDATKVFHALCWMSHLAVKSGVATVDDVIGDEGIVHEYAHMRDGGTVRRAKLIEMVKAIEQRIPGFAPPTKGRP